MDNEIRVTMTGWVATEPQIINAENSRFLTFRMACTPRYRHSSGEYRNLQTEWVTVQANRESTVDNVIRSVRRGHPLVVTGRLRTHQWEGKDGQNHWELQVLAETMGHDLRWGDVRFQRDRQVDAERAEAAADGGGEAATEEGTVSADEFALPALPGPGEPEFEGDATEPSGDLEDEPSLAA